MSESRQIDKLFSVLLVLNATGLFRFLPLPLNALMPRFNLDIGDITIALFILNTGYLVVRAEYLAMLFRKGLVSVLLILVAWPLLTILYAPDFSLRLTGLLLYCFSLMAASAVYTLANGLPAFHRVLSTCLVVTVGGLVLSMIMPQHFEAVAEMAHSRVEYSGRSFGFFMQPNKLGCGLGFLFLGWYALCRFKSTVREAVAILVFLAMMLLTGSRSGTLLAVLLVALIIVHSWLQSRVSGGHILKIFAIAMCLVVARIGMQIYMADSAVSFGRSDGSLIARVSTLLTLKLSTAESVADDISVQERLNAQLIHLELITEKPVLGHGLGACEFYRESGLFHKSAHSDVITCATEYGILYPIALYWLFLQLYISRSRNIAESAFGTNSILQFVFVTSFMLTINGDLLQFRAMHVVWGMFFAAVNCPSSVFRARAPAKPAALPATVAECFQSPGCRQTISPPMLKRASMASPRESL